MWYLRLIDNIGSIDIKNKSILILKITFYAK